MTTFAQRSFAGGELSPALYARTDTAKYGTGTRTLRNMIVMRHGGATSRPGTQFIAQTSGPNPIRLIPFVFNASQTYILEFGDSYMRVYKNGVQLTDVTKTISGITNANPAVVTSAAHGFSNGDEIQVSGITGAIGSYLNGRNFKLAGVTTNTFQLQYLDGTNVNSTLFGTYGSGGSAARVYTVGTPFNASVVPLLKFTQSADVMTFVNPTYFPIELKRTGDTAWTFSLVTFLPVLAAPTGVTLTASPAGGPFSYGWVVTSVSATGEESLASTGPGVVGAAFPTATAPGVLSWTGVAGAVSYNIYRSWNGIYGFVGISGTTTFTDIGASQDLSITPPIWNPPFATYDDCPHTACYFQQRLYYASSNNNPETVWTTQIAKFHNINTHTPLQDDDAITFRIVGRQVNAIKHLVDVGKLILLTSGGEWVASGDATGAITPTQINLKQYSYNGSADIQPIVIDSTILYVQARGNFIRDLAYEFQIDGYRGNDLTIMSSHLFEGYTIKEMTYSQIPNSILWVARSDGALLGLTYVKEQQMLAWHRHDFDGKVENVCAIPEGNEDVIYMTVLRTVNGQSVRYIERMYSRNFTDVIDYVGMDAALSYDGRNTNASHTMTLSGGTTWKYTETLTLTSSSSQFLSSDVGNSVFINQLDSNGNVTSTLRCKITAYTSATVVSVKANKTVPVALQSVATSNWSKAVQKVSGLWHLEGKSLSVFADRCVVASPNNASYNTVTVTNGIATFDQPYAVIHAGLPITSDLETLDIDTPGSTSMADKKKWIGKVTADLNRSRGLWAGGSPPTNDQTDPLEGLEELKIREDENYDDPVSLATGPVQINIQPEWNSNGRVFLRQIDPLPLTILAVMPAGLVPIGER